MSSITIEGYSDDLIELTDPDEIIVEDVRPGIKDGQRFLDELTANADNAAVFELTSGTDDARTGIRVQYGRAGTWELTSFKIDEDDVAVLPHTITVNDNGPGSYTCSWVITVDPGRSPILRRIA